MLAEKIGDALGAAFGACICAWRAPSKRAAMRSPAPLDLSGIPADPPRESRADAYRRALAAAGYGETDQNAMVALYFGPQRDPATIIRTERISGHVVTLMLYPLERRVRRIEVIGRGRRRARRELSPLTGLGSLADAVRVTRDELTASRQRTRPAYDVPALAPPAPTPVPEAKSHAREADAFAAARDYGRLAEEPAFRRVKYRAPRKSTGRILSAGEQEHRDPQTQRPYRVFTLVLNVDGGVETKRGVELEQAMKTSGAQVGDVVEVEHVGKQPVVVVENGEEVQRHKNIWNVRLVG